MVQKQPQQNLVRQYLKKQGYLRHQEICDLGISPSTIKRMVEKGEIKRVSRGLYQLKDPDCEFWSCFSPIAKKIPNGVICLLSALSYYNLTDWLVPKVWVAVGRDSWVPKEYRKKVHIHRFSDQMLTQCVTSHKIEGVDVKIFNVPKTVVDCFRYMNYVGTDVALEGLENALRENLVTPEQLTKYAKQFGSWSVMATYLDAIVSKINFNGDQDIL